MKYIKCHFIDSNIFVSVSKSDKFECVCSDYLNRDFDKYTSTKVCYESFNVLYKLESLSTLIIDYIKTNIYSNNMSDEEVSKNIGVMKKDFLKSYKNVMFPFGFNYSNFEKLVNSIFYEYSTIINKGVMYTSCVLILEDEYEKISNSYKEYNDILIDNLKSVKILYFDDTTNDNKVIEVLNEKNIHKSDASIILDCYKASEYLNENMVFVTRDGGILNNSKFISEFFDSKIYVSNPEYFINS